MTRRPLALALALTGALLTGPGIAHAEERWPLWPTQVDVVTAPLRSANQAGPTASGRVAPELVRLNALAEFENFPEELIVDDLVAALTDRSSGVQRAALQQCIARALHACIPKAQEVWDDSTNDGSVRLYALELMLLEPKKQYVDALLQALQDPREQLRNAATALAGKVVLPPDSQELVRSALIAKLGDSIPHIRASAARSLGRLGPGRGALPISRLLQDPDPNVRRWAATALGQFGDPRAIPAMMRAVEAGDEAYVSRALLHGLSLLPGEEVDELLLRLLDDQPRGLAMSNVVGAIGVRDEVSQLLLDGLLLRLAEVHLRESVVSALEFLGERARPSLERALARGLDPELTLEVERLLAALDLPTEPIPAALDEPPPTPTTPDGWREQFATPDVARRLAAVETLVAQPPTWLAAAIVRELETANTPMVARGWIAALALAPSETAAAVDRSRGGGALLWAKLGRWARDARLSTDDRCLCVDALAAAAAAKRGRRARAAQSLRALAESTSRELRTCAALSLGRMHDANALAGLLHDTSPRVRTGAALGVAIMRAAARRDGGRDPLRHSDLAAHLTLLAHSDDHVGVRLAARLAAHDPADDSAPEGLAWLRWDDRARSTETNTAWRPATAYGLDVLLPTREYGGVSWIYLHGLAATARETPVTPAARESLASLLIRFVTD